MEILALYEIAKQQNIEVIRYPMKENGSMSVLLEDGACCIGMDESVMDGGVQERVHLAHELGHCETGSFYSLCTAVDSRQRHEYRADKWAVRRLITEDDLDQAVADGCVELWQLAERFEVTEQFMKMAICFYTYGNVAAELYF